jgi:hypothetical protein
LPDSLSLEELERTYGILFSTTSQELLGHRNQIQRLVPSITVDNHSLVRSYKVDDPESPTTTHIPLTPLVGTFRELLMPFLSTVAPPELVAFHKDSTPASNNPTLMELVSSPNPTNFSRLLVPIRGVLQYPPSSGKNNYSEFPYFGTNLRALVEIQRRETQRGVVRAWGSVRGSGEDGWWLAMWLMLVVGGGWLRFSDWGNPRKQQVEDK